jgi:hypothetical protein
MNDIFDEPPPVHYDDEERFGTASEMIAEIRRLRTMAAANLHGLLWRKVTEADKDGFGRLFYGIHDHDAPPGASQEVKAGDHWWCILQWDLWREHPNGRRAAWAGWVFAATGQPAWSEPLRVCDLTPPKFAP